MAAATEAHRHYLSHIPACLCVRYLSNVNSYRRRIIEMALNSFTQGYIHKSNISNDKLPCVLVQAECLINTEIREVQRCRELRFKV